MKKPEMPIPVFLSSDYYRHLSQSTLKDTCQAILDNMMWICLAAVACVVLSAVYIACIGWWLENFIPVYVLGGVYAGLIILGMFLIGLEGLHADYHYSFRPALYVSQFVSFVLFLVFVIALKAEILNKPFRSRFRYRKVFDNVDSLLCGIVMIFVISFGLSFVPLAVTVNEKIERWCLDSVTEEIVSEEICSGIRGKYTNNPKAEHVWNEFREHTNSRLALDSIVGMACLGKRDTEEHTEVFDELNKQREEHYLDWNFTAVVRDVVEVCPLYRKDIVDALTKTTDTIHPYG